MTVISVGYKVNIYDALTDLPREKNTFLQILERQIERISKRIGIKLKPKELGTEKIGPDTMHKIILEPELNKT